jgi:hypothetical protein
MRPLLKQTTILSGQSLSSQTTGTHGTPAGGIDAAGLNLVGLEMPATWTVADITFSVSSDGVTFRDAFNPDGSEFKIIGPAAIRFIPIVGADTDGWRYIKVRSGTSAAPVPQGADRIMGLVLRDLSGED